MKTRGEYIERMIKLADECSSPVCYLPTDLIRFNLSFIDSDSPCFCIYDYFPNRVKDQTGDVGIVARNIVYEFKDGRAPEIYANLFAAAIVGETRIIFDPDTVLLTIPASTRLGHKMRFQKFSRLLSENLGIVDGFEYLEITMDRKRNDVRNGMPISNCISLSDYYGVYGKDVLLIDDVYASGKSFRQMTSYLLSADVNTVQGLFLGKSIDRYS